MEEEKQEDKLGKKPEQEIKQKQSGFQNIRDWQENNPELVAQMERDAQFRQKRMEERMKEIEEERKKNEPS